MATRVFVLCTVVASGVTTVEGELDECGRASRGSTFCAAKCPRQRELHATPENYSQERRGPLKPHGQSPSIPSRPLYAQSRTRRQCIDDMDKAETPSIPVIS